MSDEGYEKHIERFTRLLPSSGDLTLILLKGHLLIEEQLLAILEGFAQTPSCLKKAKLSFSQKLWMVRALTPAVLNDRFFPFAKRLNALRNALAHNAELEELEDRVDELLQIARGLGCSVCPMPPLDRSRAIAMAIAWTCGLVRELGHFVVEAAKQKNQEGLKPGIA
ncbi:MAG: hypothetical protein HQ567_19145 [Candidatus Nealsonbacteria bacterium]|nr:hypothetical protein [Candidatus Nealsonbacteria bacterium]